MANAEAQDEEQEGEQEEEGCVTVGECISANPDAFDALMAIRPDLAPVIDSIRDQCFSNYAATFPVVPENCQ